MATDLAPLGRIMYNNEKQTSLRSFCHSPVYTDDVTVAGITANQQYFSAVTSVSDSFGKDVEDGIMGLAFQSISELNKAPFFQNVSSMYVRHSNWS